MNAERIVDILLEDEDIDISPAEVVAGADEARFNRALAAFSREGGTAFWKTKWTNALNALGCSHNPWVWPATNSLESGSVQIVQGVSTPDAVFYALRDDLSRKLYLPQRDLEIIHRLLATIKAQESDEIHGEDEDWYE